MKMTDGRKTINITMRKWNGSGYGPDFSQDFFDFDGARYDRELDCYVVHDVDYCIEQACGYANDIDDFSDCKHPRLLIETEILFFD